MMRSLQNEMRTTCVMRALPVMHAFGAWVERIASPITAQLYHLSLFIVLTRRAHLWYHKHKGGMGMKNRLITLGQLLINVLFVPFYFVEWICYEAVFPNGRRNYYYSPIVNLKGEPGEWLLYVSLGLTVLSPILCGVCLWKKNKALSVARHIVFCLSAIAFVFAMLIASSVGRGF